MRPRWKEFESRCPASRTPRCRRLLSNRFGGFKPPRSPHLLEKPTKAKGARSRSESQRPGVGSEVYRRTRTRKKASRATQRNAPTTSSSVDEAGCARRPPTRSPNLRQSRRSKTSRAGLNCYENAVSAPSDHLDGVLNQESAGEADERLLRLLHAPRPTAEAAGADRCRPHITARRRSDQGACYTTPRTPRRCGLNNRLLHSEHGERLGR